jgi:agmatine deiminase
LPDRSASVIAAAPTDRYLRQAMAAHLQPAEWSAHDAVWLAWPSHADLWGDAVEEVRAAFVELCHAIVDPSAAGALRGERLEILVPDATHEAMAREALGACAPRFHHIPFGDIWLRDTAPIFVHDAAGAVVAATFGFNGWGHKYDLPHDTEVALRIATASQLPVVRHDFVLEGGSVDSDGQGTVLTSRQCLLADNRGGATEAAIVDRLAALGARKVLWVSEGLANDHTDGHIDTIARYVAIGLVAVMTPSGDDPNRAVLERIVAELEGQTDAAGRRLELARIPSPGRVEAPDGRVMPASYLNFYVGNTTVIVPTYRQPTDAAAVDAIADLFPERRTVGIDALRLLEGGGAFHCISQQQPSSK